MTTLRNKMTENELLAEAESKGRIEVPIYCNRQKRIVGRYTRTGDKWKYKTENRKVYLLTEEEINQGNRTWLPGRSQHEYGEVGTVFDRNQYPEDKKRHWYLYYVKTGGHTGGFETRTRAIEWFLNGGR